VGGVSGRRNGTATDLTLPRTFDARYGHGIRRGVSLGGGGTFFVAWQLGYLTALADRGVRIDRADRLVGTSAGSVVAATLAHDRLHLLHAESQLMAKVPSVMNDLFPSRVDTPSQQLALNRYVQSADSHPATIRSIGHAALAAVTPSPSTMTRGLALVIGTRWSSDALWMTCVDTLTGDRGVATRSSAISMALGAAASSAVPGIFTPQVIGGRKYMDGGVGGTAVHLDLLAGAGKALVLSLYRDSDLTHGMLTLAPGDLDAELAELRASGTEVFFQVPRSHPMDVKALMDPKAVPGAMAMGSEQAHEDVDAGGLASFWA